MKSAQHRLWWNHISMPSQGVPRCIDPVLFELRDSKRVNLAVSHTGGAGRESGRTAEPVSGTRTPQSRTNRAPAAVSQLLIDKNIQACWFGGDGGTPKLPRQLFVSPFKPDVRFAPIVLQTFFAAWDTNFPSSRRADRIIGGLHHFVSNSPATSVVVLKLHRWTIAACFVFSRKIGRTDFGTFATLSANRRHRGAGLANRRVVAQ
jgi:hypothetical protein